MQFISVLLPLPLFLSTLVGTPASTDDESTLQPIGPSFFSSVTGGRNARTGYAFERSVCLEQGDDLDIHFTASNAESVSLEAGGVITSWGGGIGIGTIEGDKKIRSAAFGDYVLTATGAGSPPMQTKFVIHVTACETTDVGGVWGDDEE